MAGVNKVSKGDDEVFESVDAAIEGGQLVVPSTTDATHAGLLGIKAAGAGATNVLGVAARRAVPVADQSPSGTTGDGYPVFEVNPVNELTTVYRHAIVEGVTYGTDASADYAYGDKLKAAASGKVVKWVDGTDHAGTLVGECAEVGGVAKAGGTGRMYVY